MSKLRNIFIILLATLALAACTDNEQFRINGVIDGKPTMNLRVAYYADGALKTILTAAREGEFEIYGSSRQPTVVEIMDYEFRPLARLYAANGETFEVKFDRYNPTVIEIDGNDVCQRWAEFLRETPDLDVNDPAKINAEVGKYIAAHPDDILSTLLLLTSYDSSVNVMEADSLMAMIAPEARPSALTEGYTFLLQRLVTDATTAPVKGFRYVRKGDREDFDPAKSDVNLLAFTHEGSSNYHVQADALETIAKARSKKLAVYDLSVAPPLNIEDADSLKRHLGSLPGGIAARGVDVLGIQGIPFYIVCDSAGVQYYRGGGLGRATEVIDSLLSTK